MAALLWVFAEEEERRKISHHLPHLPGLYQPQSWIFSHSQLHLYIALLAATLLSTHPFLQHPIISLHRDFGAGLLELPHSSITGWHLQHFAQNLFLFFLFFCPSILNISAQKAALQGGFDWWWSLSWVRILKGWSMGWWLLSSMLRREAFDNIYFPPWFCMTVLDTHLTLLPKNNSDVQKISNYIGFFIRKGLACRFTNSSQ